MDGAIPIGRWSIGLDPLLGLVPGFGDLIGAVISMRIVVRTVQAAFLVIGAIPLAGDLFDFAYKSNMKNLRIYEQTFTTGAPQLAGTRDSFWPCSWALRP